MRSRFFLSASSFFFSCYSTLCSSARVCFAYSTYLVKFKSSSESEFGATASSAAANELVEARLAASQLGRSELRIGFVGRIATSVEAGIAVVAGIAAAGIVARLA